MADDQFLDAFSSFMMELRCHDLPEARRNRILFQVQDSLTSILTQNGIVCVHGEESSSAIKDDCQNGQHERLRPILKLVGRAILTEHPDHMKTREIFTLLDMDHDGVISAKDLQSGLLIHMKLEILPSQIKDMMSGFENADPGALHYFEFVQFLQAAMQAADEAGN
uniref:EF-hand domain-containing protein n=1 Tax=Spongospora subterranea TaxID=70186 RepID=A0A0H5QKN0_9EUKA|eukprot:CRZ02568.1 hypothetical protein [Spongospora subterranea]